MPKGQVDDLPSSLPAETFIAERGLSETVPRRNLDRRAGCPHPAGI